MLLSTLRSAGRRLRSSLVTAVRRLPRLSADAGMSTAEYAVGLVAACAFAAVLYKILTSDTMQSLLRGLISRALHVTL
jgi:hypothetical protein